MNFFRKLKSFFNKINLFFKFDSFFLDSEIKNCIKEKLLFGLSCATVGIILMFRNYIPTFFTTKNPFSMNYGFNSVMNFIWLMT